MFDFKIRRWVISAVIALLPVVPPAFGQERPLVMIYGQGISACSEYLAVYATSDLHELSDGTIQYRPSFGPYFSWVLGFVSGVNWKTYGSNQITFDFSTAPQWLASWCRDNPQKSLLQAVIALIQR